jgi:predicted acyltransferase
MFLLVAEGARIYHVLLGPGVEETVLQPIFTQFTHHPWNGLRFWDLVQPYFMFIVGVAMPFSFAKRWARGDSQLTTLRHVLYRSAVLLALGVSLHIVSAGHLVFELWNVLAQLSFTYLVAYLLMRKSFRTQILFTLGLLLTTELLYRFWPVAGFDQPFTPDQNFGSWIDMLLMGKLSAGHWVAFNAVPTTAHTMWGVLAGYVLKSDRTPLEKIKLLVLPGLAAVILGYAMDPFTPIIKRICTTSFVIVSGGWCLLTLALCYWVIDILAYQRWAQFARVFGLNPIFIYLFAHLGGDDWLSTIVRPFVAGVLGGSGPYMVALTTALAVLWIDWYIVNWLHRHRIYIRL